MENPETTPLDASFDLLARQEAADQALTACAATSPR
jgi:hypothetical protein